MFHRQNVTEAKWTYRQAMNQGLVVLTLSIWTLSEQRMHTFPPLLQKSKRDKKGHLICKS